MEELKDKGAAMQTANCVEMKRSCFKKEVL